MKTRTFAILCLIVGAGFVVYAFTLLPSLQSRTTGYGDALHKVFFFFALGLALVAVAQKCGLFSAFRRGPEKNGVFDADGISDSGCGGDADGDCGGD
jgi:hypothetical protein